MKIWIVLFFLSLGAIVNAQEVISNGKAYEVRNKAIFKDGVDITATLEKEEEAHIFKTLNNQLNKAKDAEDVRKKLEKAARKSDKALKKAAKELKSKQKAQDRFNKATKKLEQNQEKYEKLKKRGKLSPQDEVKWLKMLEDYKDDLEKATQKLQRS
ncbi:hypothetical protein LX77_03741 [Gelidibacter algens]|uniref:Uncharacterized protein n=1 Tax=Gelidibacter algens TaxID=49280 RepID=A0A1A7QVR1_9FLAO|nr:hypothetical protein [Gelidibacter algens]OBX23626.1 hypothetical protein A9996_15795 [Gelidibacter algens]RAJ18706.1 hypothetical protein LX77_03741 [Gelidibacter algens]